MKHYDDVLIDWVSVMYIIAILITVALIIRLVVRVQDCHDRGGTFIETATGGACVKLERLEKP